MLGRHPRLDLVRGVERAAPEVGVDRARLDEHDADAPPPQLHPHRVGDPLERELRRVVGAHEGRGVPPADRADEQHPPRRLAHQRKHRLGDRHLRDDVHVELPAQVVNRHRLERPGDDDPRVVDDGVEPGSERAGQRRDLRGVSDVEDDRAHRASGRPDVRRGAQGVAVLRAPDAGVDLPAALGEAQRDDAPDAAAGAGDEDREAQDAGRQTCMMSRIEMMPSTSPLETTTRWRNRPGPSRPPPPRAPSRRPRTSRGPSGDRRRSRCPGPRRRRATGRGRAR